MNNLFFKARIRLTLLYVAMIVVLLLIFSQIIYISVSGNIKNNIEGDFATQNQQEIFVQKGIHNLQITLLLANAGILIVVGGLSFFLAGRTLSPIHNTLEQQKQFLSDASHELRTPLAILQTNMDVSLKEKSKGSKEYLEIQNNREEVERMSSLLNELLLLSRLDASETVPSFENINIKEVIKDTLSRLEAYAATNRVKFILSEFPKGEIQTSGNKDLLSQAISNIIKNAIDYNRKNGSVFISLINRENKAVIIIRDTGVGIPSEHLSQIFNRFYKVEESRSEHGGSGLGLSITKQILLKHSGGIVLESTPNKGTTATLLLPLSKAS